MNQKIYIAGSVVLLVCIALIFRYLPSKDSAVVREYYSVIDHQEKIDEDVTVTESDRAALAECREGRDNRPQRDCIRDFYDAYTMKNGVEKAFRHLARTESELSDSLQDCHYFSHGIGNAAFRLSGKDPYKAFDIMQSGALYKNIATCGNGYFHGVVEEFAAGEKNPDKLAKKLSTVCGDKRMLNRANCYHGAGHAALIQMDFDISKTIGICDQIPGRPADVFSCYTGAFMEYTQMNTGFTRTPDGAVNLDFCDSLDKKYQPACYTEFGYFIEKFSANRNDYEHNIGQCKRIGDALNRMACVKLFAIRSVRIAHYGRINEMCANTSSDRERVICTAIIADKIAGSIDDSRRSTAFDKAVQDICGILPQPLSKSCLYIVTKRNLQLFYTSKLDLAFPLSP